MELYAAIDLMGGKIVRLVKGVESSQITYPGTPAEYAERWSEAGFPWIHVVDLDAALGRGENLEAIREIVKASSAPVQVGGGVRGEEKVEALLSMGAARVVLGSLVFKNFEQVARLGNRYGFEKFVIALDYSADFKVLAEGWKRKAEATVIEAYEALKSIGFNKFLLTSRERDGLLKGPDLETLSRIPMELRARSIVAGGISSPNDVKSLRCLGFMGAVVGRALYDGVVRPEELLEAAGSGC